MRLVNYAGHEMNLTLFCILCFHSQIKKVFRTVHNDLLFLKYIKHTAMSCNSLANIYTMLIYLERADK